MKYKKTLSIAMLFSVVLLCTACSGGNASGSADVSTTSEIPVVLNQAEYVLYQNIFYNDYGAQYQNIPVTKNGVFAVVQDAFNNRDRYYVWGYLDNTMCCDWQWEIVPRDTMSLPPTGSLVTVSGIFTADEQALDDYWILDAEVTTVTQYAGAGADLNMLAMSDTLERVQMLNILYRQEAFEGKSFTAYGRIAGPNLLEDPYYDNSWQIPYASADSAEALAIGTNVVCSGKVTSGMLGECKVTVR